MAKSIGKKGGRVGNVKGRSEYISGVAGNWVKRDGQTFGISKSHSSPPFKGVRKEK